MAAVKPVSDPASKVSATIRRLGLPRDTTTAGAVEWGATAVVVVVVVAGGAAAATVAVTPVLVLVVVSTTGEAAGSEHATTSVYSVASTAACLLGRAILCHTTDVRHRVAATTQVVGLLLIFGACSTSSPTAVVSPAPVGPVGGATPPTAADPEAVTTAPPPDNPTATNVPVVRTPSGVLVPVLDRADGGWRVSTPCGRETVVPVATPAKPVTVVIDPGHGGWDPGAVGPNGLSEAALNLSVSKYAQAALERDGVTVALTRDADHGVNLPNRAKLALGLQAKAFVSVHHNAASQAVSSTPGSEAYYQQHSEDSKRLAGLIYEEVVAALSAFRVQWVSVGTGVTWRTRSNGEDYYAMVRLPKGVPATLAELAFISNPPEATLLAREDTQRIEGEAIAKGVLRFLTTDDPGSGYMPGGQMPPRQRPPGWRPGGGGGDDGCDDPPL
jgi:N-acetylmuramoyl-L-alanine amidase